jgi:hypothetical protein
MTAAANSSRMMIVAADNHRMNGFNTLPTVSQFTAAAAANVQMRQQRQQQQCMTLDRKGEQKYEAETGVTKQK